MKHLGERKNRREAPGGKNRGTIHLLNDLLHVNRPAAIVRRTLK